MLKGLNFLIPVIDKVKYLQSLKEIVIDIPEQSAITKDNVTLRLDGVLYLKIFDPYLASYGVDDAEHGIFFFIIIIVYLKAFNYKKF